MRHSCLEGMLSRMAVVLPLTRALLSSIAMWHHLFFLSFSRHVLRVLPRTKVGTVETALMYCKEPRDS
jgi:hypothetical protein